MNPFQTHKGKVAILWRNHVDTDQIIPKQFLKSIKRTGFESGLFFDWRFLKDGNENPTFELNQPRAREASILLTGANFGCGSSREHAVWALMQYGFRVIVSPSFADIFKGNSFKNGLLLVELEETQLKQLKQIVENNPNQEMTVNLQKQNIVFSDCTIHFHIDSSHKERLIKGLDDIAETLLHEGKIKAYEKKSGLGLKVS